MFETEGEVSGHYHLSRSNTRGKEKAVCCDLGHCSLLPKSDLNAVYLLPNAVYWLQGSFMRSSILPLDNTFERSRKWLWKKILLKTKKIPLKDQEQPGTLCGRQHGSFCWSHPLHLLFFKHHFYHVLEFFDSVGLLFDVSFHHSPRWVVFK